jgi:flavin reductase (DIM6/NTAB) family NADH-FMN oxidoreductase RutF
MRFDLDQVETAIAYKLLAATVMPRPIAWVVTQGANGINAAPYSFFNVMGSAPPTIAIGLLADPERRFKDTAQNNLDTGEFVINLVPERMVKAMNVTAVNAPRGTDELSIAGLAVTPSVHIAPPSITDSPVIFE